MSNKGQRCNKSTTIVQSYGVWRYFGEYTKYYRDTKIDMTYTVSPVYDYIKWLIYGKIKSYENESWLDVADAY